MAKIDALGFVNDFFKVVLKFFDDAYRDGYLLYLIVGLIVFLVWVVFF